MSTIGIKNKFAELFSKIAGDVHHRHHGMARDREEAIVRQQRVQDAIDQYTIDHGYHNGTPKTHHGVSAEFKIIAEFNKNEIRQAMMEGRKPKLMVKSPDVNGPHDMVQFMDTVVNGHETVRYYQAKYCKDVVRTLDSCIEHAKKYQEDYGSKGSGVYVIDKKQAKLVDDILSGNPPPGTNPRFIEVVKGRVEKLEAVTGKPIKENVLPGVSYEDAQRENNAAVHKRRKQDIENTHKKEKANIKDAFSPALKKSMTVGLEAAGVAACISVAFRIGGDMLNGKNIFAGDYDKEDCLDVALKTSKDAGIAFITATTMHYLETCKRHTGLIAVNAIQLAAAVTPIIHDYWEGKISFSEMKAGIYSNVSATIISVGYGLAIGAMATKIISVITPIAAGLSFPGFIAAVLSALIGMGIGFLLDCAYKYTTEILNADVKDEQAKHDAFIETLREAYYSGYEEIEKKFAEAFNLAERSVDKSLAINDRLKALDDLSEHYGGHRVDTEFSADKTMAFLFD